MSALLDKWGLPLLSLMGILVGFLLASQIHVSVLADWSPMVIVALVITADLLSEGIKHYLEGNFNLKPAFFTYVMSLLLAFIFIKVGTLMEVDLYLALFIVFAMKLFSNLAYISQKCFSNDWI